MPYRRVSAGRNPAKARLFSLIAAPGPLSGDGAILIHLSKAEAREPVVTNFELRDERPSGNSSVLFFASQSSA
jgi:hypothetical protein